MFDPKSVKIEGPLVPYMDGFWSELMLQGYTTLSGEKLFRVACQISRWLKRRRRGIRDLTDECVAQFTAHRRRQGRKEFVKPHAVEPVLRYLRKLCAAPPLTAPSETPVDLFVREYTDHLARERGLTAATIRGYGRFARRFITAQPQGPQGALYAARTRNGCGAARLVQGERRGGRRSCLPEPSGHAPEQ